MRNLRIYWIRLGSFYETIKLRITVSHIFKKHTRLYLKYFMFWFLSIRFEPKYFFKMNISVNISYLHCYLPLLLFQRPPNPLLDQPLIFNKTDWILYQCMVNCLQTYPRYKYNYLNCSYFHGSGSTIFSIGGIHNYGPASDSFERFVDFLYLWMHGFIHYLF